SGGSSAASGDASATGLATHNTFANSSTADVRVGGMNQAPITVQSASSVNINDTGVADAQSGTAAALAAGIPLIAAEIAGGGAAASDSVTATGLTALASVDHSIETSRVVPGGTSPQGALNITQTQTASAVIGGSASA